ncbi:MAG: EAL domain-containing protein [Firmicutes bacterium]|nr:EAL domain-containing protein [Bacillota bacterium]
MDNGVRFVAEGIVLAALLVAVFEAVTFLQQQSARWATVGAAALAVAGPPVLLRLAGSLGLPVPGLVWLTALLGQSWWLGRRCLVLAGLGAAAAAAPGPPGSGWAWPLGLLAAAVGLGSPQLARRPGRQTAAFLGVALAWGVARAAGGPLAVSLVTAVGVGGFVLTHRQRTARLAAAEAAATHDALTGALTRYGWAAWRARQPAEATGTVVACDLDDFKAVNDTYGHDVGDRILQAVVERWRSVLRVDDAIVRPGGDEFTIWVPGLAAGEAPALTHRLQAAVSAQPVDTRVGPLPVLVSCGWATGPLEAATATAADQALLVAKRQGKHAVAGPDALPGEPLPVPTGLGWLTDAARLLWAQASDAWALVDPAGRLLTANAAFQTWVGRPWPALLGWRATWPEAARPVPVTVGDQVVARWVHFPVGRDPTREAPAGSPAPPPFRPDQPDWRLTAVFQPLVQLPGRIVGWEALIRPQWHAQPIDPESFFHAAGAAGTTAAADLACLDAIVRALAGRPGPPGCRLHVNVTVELLDQPALLQPRLAALRAAWPNGPVVLEISEHVPRDAPLVSQAALAARYPGIRWAQDDFGHGQSDPLRLLEWDPDWVKLDRLLVQAALASADGRAWLGALVAWSRRRGRPTWCAEGVETAGMAQALAAIGVPEAQGYLWGRPGPRLDAPCRPVGDDGQSEAVQP